MPQAMQDRMQTLMQRNAKGSISSQEHKELQELVERGNRLTLRKAEVAAILKQRDEP